MGALPWFSGLDPLHCVWDEADGKIVCGGACVPARPWLTMGGPLQHDSALSVA